MTTEHFYLQPATLDEAMEMAQANEHDFRFLAGGTDVWANRFQGNETASCLIDITGVGVLKDVKRIGNYLSIGSLVRLHEMNTHEAVRAEFPALITAANSVGSPLIRRTATLGGNILCENRCIFYNQSAWWRDAVGLCLKCEGNICIATGSKKYCFSEFVSDTAPALISMDAMVEVVDRAGVRRIKLEDIYTGDGLRPRNLDKTALVLAILLPLEQQFRSVFKKLRQRESLEFSSLTTAVSVNRYGKVKMALGGVDPKPVVVEGTLESDRAELIKQALKKARAVDNDMYTRNYRREMIAVFLNRSFDALLPAGAPPD